MDSIERNDIRSQSHFNSNSDEEPYEKKRRPWCWKITALLLLLAFTALALPNFAHIFSRHYAYLDQSRELQDDPLVMAVRPAIISIKGWPEQGTASRFGTGCNIDPEGVVLTNWHIVEDVSRVEIEFEDGQVYTGQSVVPVQGADLALVLIEGQDLPYLPLSFTGSVKAGQEVTVIGNPQGFERTAQRGLVEDIISNGEGRFLFTVDITAQPGSSGSGVLNEQEELIGVVYASINREDQKRALAIPLISVKKELQEALREAVN